LGRRAEDLKPFWGFDFYLRFAFLIRALSCGGAERQLVLLARGLAALGHYVSVTVFYRGGEFDQDLANSGVKVNILEKRGRWEIFSFLLRTRRILRAEAADVIHGYLGGANLVATFLKPSLKPSKIVWGIRASDLDGNDYDWLHRLSGRVEALFARATDLIISNSEAGMRYIASVGYPSDRIAVIPNGIDLTRFDIDSVGRERSRAAWGLSPSDIAVGRVGRIDPLKDYPGFLRAAAIALREEPRLKFICIGGGKEADLAALQTYANELGLGSRILWTGFVRDMRSAYNGFDIFVSSSKRGEGFPNVLGEAMACGLPCVATDVGDAKKVLANDRFTVRHGDTAALGKAIAEIAREPRDSIAIRRSIAERYSAELLVQRTVACLSALCQPRRSCAASVESVQLAAADR